MKARMITLYAIFLVVGFLLLAMVWHWQMAGTFFISRDRGIILDFVPPFARAGTSGDVYLKPQRVVYTIWGMYVAAGLILQIKPLPGSYRRAVRLAITTVAPAIGGSQIVTVDRLQTHRTVVVINEIPGFPFIEFHSIGVNVGATAILC